MWYSHKLGGPAVRYEVALSMQIAKTVWAYGPIPASVPDVAIFRRRLEHKLGHADGFLYVTVDTPMNDVSHRRDRITI